MERKQLGDATQLHHPKGMNMITYPYLTSNGTPVIRAGSYYSAAAFFGVAVDAVFLVEELSSRDRHEELVLAVLERKLFGVAC